MSLLNLPVNIFALISFKFLDMKSMFHFGMSCQKCSKIFSNELMWKEIAERQLGDTLDKDKKITWKNFVKENFFEW